MTEHTMSQQLLSLLNKIKSMTTFIEALVETDQQHLALHLDRNLTADLQKRKQIKLTEGRTVYHAAEMENKLFHQITLCSLKLYSFTWFSLYEDFAGYYTVKRMFV